MRIAFCFLTQEDVHQPDVWEYFFAGIPSDQFGIYCHPKHSERVVSPLLAGRIIPDRVATRHRHVSIVEATLALYAAAYRDNPENQYFVLVAENTIPIVPFAAIRDELARCDRRSLISYNVPQPGTEYHARLDAIPEKSMFASPFYFHDQWVVLHRRHVGALLGRSYLSLFERVFAADEHYIMNVLIHATNVPLDQVINRRTTFVNWQEPELKLHLHPETRQVLGQTFHPKTYASISPADLQAARDEWFFRKVAASCDCELVFERVRG